MKNRNRNKFKIGKRVVSAFMALVMVLYSFPITDIGNEISRHNPFILNVQAADDDTPPSNYEFLHNSNNEISLTVQEFYRYSQSYNSYPGYHQNDKITIKTSSSITAYYERGFKGLGTSTKPFAGSIEIEANKDIVLNLDAPLFSYVTDTAVLNNGDTLKIARFYGYKIPSGETKNDTTPLIAENVVLDTDNPNKAKSTWNISVVKPSATDDELLDGTLEAFGGMIGTMAANTQLKLNVTMDQQTGDTDPIELKSKSNLGLACGLIKQNAILHFSIGASEGGTIRNISKIETSSGNVGGLVGEMESGSTFYYTGTNIQEDNTAIASGNGYAGGIVGKNDSATITFSETTYNIKQYMSGTKGVGGIYGYYKPKSDENTIDLSIYNIVGQVNNTGNAANIGGLFGEFVCDHSFTIDTNTTVKSKHASGEAASYGGLIGKYINTSLKNTLTIGSVTTETKNESGFGVSYGGAIGIADDTNANYIKFDGFKVDKAYNANHLTFGGLVGSAKKTFVDANDVTIKVNGVFYGGGLVGDLGNGSLRMTGTTDLSNAKSVAPTADAYKYGQIVGNRDSAVVFAETGWVLKRSEAVEADDIGAWGEVIRFDSKESGLLTDYDEDEEEIEYNITKEQFDSEDVLTVNENLHTVSIESPASTIGSVADFAKTALSIQLGNSDIVSVIGGVGDLSLSDDISLVGTGFTGFTRDNNASNDMTDSHCVFDGDFDADGYSVALSIGESYGYRGENDLSSAESRTDGDGRIYNHRYNGLFGILKGSVIGNDEALTHSEITGKISVSPTANSIYVGSIAGVVKESVEINCFDVTTEIDYAGSKDIYLGRMIGEINQPNVNTDDTFALYVFDCDVSGDVLGNNNSSETCIGGVVGKIFHTKNEIQNWYFNTVSISGKITNSAEKTEQMIGGLVAKINGYSATSGFKSRTLMLDSVSTENLEISAGKATSMGGLLGYQWLNTDVIVGYKDEENPDGNTSLTIGSGSKITATGAVSDMAGLVYNATGKWIVNDLNISEINVAANTPKSFGMIVNKGWYCDSGKNHNTDASSSAIYILLPTTDCYTISSSTLTSLNSADVFDELVAFTAYYTGSGANKSSADANGDEYILQNGAGVISIKTSETNGLNMNGSTASRSYQAQTSQGAKPNPWSRYYYNLDTVTVDSSTKWSSASAQQKLMSWGLNKYAHQSIRSNFYDGFNGTITSSTYDMDGYSWYPVDVEANVKVQGTFEFHNYEFEQSESVNGGINSSQKTSLYNAEKNSTTQHYMLHNGLFRNVYSSSNVTVDNATLQGNVGLVNSYSGVLICGTVFGGTDTSKAKINIDGLTLEGVYIHNITNLSGDSATYAPLVINKIAQYTNLTAKNISTSTTTDKTYNTSSFVPYIKTDSNSFPKAASSLIGVVGSSTAKGIIIDFTKIRLDGRTTSVANTSDLDTAYGTNRSIFTKATLLDKFEFDSGSTGTYNYTWADDWGSGGRYVTYGKEVGYTNEGEFPNIERKYIEGSTDTAEEYTNPTNSADTSGGYASTFTSSFLPYVAIPYTSDGTTHQLEVNHRTTVAEGCGTYNDPYIINSSTDLENFAKILNGNYTGTTVTLPTAAERAVYWCDDKPEKSHHKLFAYGTNDSTTFDCEGETSLSTTEVRTYLAGAYYKFGKAVELETTFPGMSNFTSIDSTNNFAVFRGVIDGGGYTITNKSTNPLIINSYGSVVQNMTLSVESAGNISLIQDNTTDVFPACKSYGAVIGNILGGDNIIDDVSVTYDSMTTKIDLRNNAQLIPVGGYVGVIVDGALVFKNMANKPQGLLTNSDLLTYSVYNSKTKKWTATAIDSSLANWLYVNPIIGRVLNGYAVTEGNAYVTSEDNVTMHNGIKNYSIADINKNETNKLKTSAYTTVSGATLTTTRSTDVYIPNEQALFVMSLLTQSSTTVGATSALSSVSVSDSYDRTYKLMRRAAYSAIDTDGSKNETPDYKDYAAYDNATTGVPYLVANYTDVIDATADYGVLALTNNNAVCNFLLGGDSSEWTLPDGFRGIGAIGFNRADMNDMTISLHKFSGKNNNGEGSVVTIIMNMSLQHYESGFENYLPVNNSKGGFGLFDTLRHNRSDQGTKTDDYKISDLNITGTIDYFVFKHDSSDGTATYISTYVNNSAYLNTGGIAGCAGFSGTDSITVEKIGISGLTVNGFETAGGFFGNLQLANNASNHQVKISNIEATTAFTVTSKRYSGGIIGYFKQGNLLIDSVTITLPNVISEYRGNAYQDFENGAGGVIGFAQTADKNAPVILSNVTLGEENKAIVSRIGYKEGATFFRSADGNNSKGDDTVVAGGIIGRSDTNGHRTGDGTTYDHSLLIKDCNVYNVSIYGHRVGGIIGTDTDARSRIVVINTNVKSDHASIIKGVTDNVTISNLQHRACAGFVGYIKGSNSSPSYFDTCTLVGYSLIGFNDTAGFCANLSTAIVIRNSVIKDIMIQSNYSGALVGYDGKEIYGYNILCDNIQFKNKSGVATIQNDNGYLVGKIKGGNLKMAGLSIQNSVAETGCFVPDRLAGVGGTAVSSNSGNYYVFFADYKGTASSSNKTFANVNTSATNVKDFNNTVVSDNYSYVTSSPKMYIGDNQFLTGDAVSSAVYDSSAFKKIKDNLSDNTIKGRYQIAANNASLTAEVQEHLTTSKEEFGSAFPYNFPLLVVEDTNKEKVTNYINYYINSLLNTNYKFQQDVNNVFKVTLHKCTYSSSTRNFTIDGAGTGSLQKYATGFQMDATKIDNANPDTPQFTLMDVQLLNPSKNTEVAYHLYIPIYVKKMIQYKFNAEIASGTNYYSDAYASINSKTLFENLGNPVTMRIEYTYDRDETDWADAINGGENVLDGSNYFKELKMSMNSNGWAPDSRLVLVDANNNDKHYYLDSSIVTADSNGTYHIPFDSFTANGASGGTAYKPVPMSSLLDYTITATTNGPLVVTTDTSKATVKSPDGTTMYMPRPDGNSSQGYTATVTKVNPEVYYLSIFTNKNSGNDKVYHYEINSVERFEQHITDNENWKPNKIIRSYNDPVHLIIGNLYTNNTLELSVTPRVASTYEMTKSNNVLTVTMTSHISLTQAAKDERIPQNLAQNTNSTIFQTFLMNYDMMEKDALTSKIGVDTSAIQSVTITDYRIYYGLTVPTEAADIEANPGEDVKSIASDPEDLMNSNYIELRNNKNLNEYLRNSGSGHDNAATIQVTFALEYSEKNLSKQFPERKDESDSTIGSLVRGYSNISSVAESGAYSAISLPASDTHRYYTKNLSSANLTYNADKTPNSPNGLYSSLGINPFDEQTAKVVTNKGHIDSTAIYSFVDLVDPGEYIEFNLTLTCKNDGYDRTPLVIADYLTDLTIKANNTTLFTQGTSTDTATLKAYTSADGKTITLRAHKSQLKEIADKIYTIDISYDVLTGEANGFGTTKAYSNYKVALTADIYDAIDTTVSPDNPSHASDHIIYTNSKLQYNMISE